MTLRPPLATDTLPSRWSTVAGAVVLLTVIISVLLTAFAWPSVRSSVHDVPIAVAGPAARSTRSGDRHSTNVCRAASRSPRSPTPPPPNS